MIKKFEEFVSEGLIGNMWGRAAGTKQRKEDQLTDDDKKALETYIDMFVDRVVYDCDYYDSFSELKIYIKDNFNALPVSKYDFNIDRIINHIVKNEDEIWEKTFGRIKTEWENEHNEPYPDEGLEYYNDEIE